MLRTVTFRRVLTVFALLVLIVPARAGDPEPFPGSGTGIITGQEAVDEGVWVSFDLSGEGSPIGAITGAGQYLVDPQGETFTDGTLTFTTTDGDTVELILEGTLNEDGSFEATATISGGTGRYANATGNADLSGTPNPDGTFAVVWEGMIAY